MFYLPSSLLKNRGRREPGNIREESFRLPARYHAFICMINVPTLVTIVMWFNKLSCNIGTLPCPSLTSRLWFIRLLANRPREDEEGDELHLLFVDVPAVQQQRGVLDCGVLLLLSLGDDVTKLNFNQDQCESTSWSNFKIKWWCQFCRQSQALITSAVFRMYGDWVILHMLDAWILWQYGAWDVMTVLPLKCDCINYHPSVSRGS